jgi:hypothetical protein
MPLKYYDEISGMTREEVERFLENKLNLQMATIDEQGESNIQRVWFSEQRVIFQWSLLFLSIVAQHRPACADSNNKNSNSLLSLWTGTAHSLS